MRSDIAETIRELKPELEKRFGIRKLAVFGSYARDEERDDSDIDLAIVEIDKKDYFNRVNAKYFLEERLQKSVDIGYLDSFRSFIKKRVEKEMVYV